ncbi:MAG: hypothetical protein ABEJ30_05950 [Halorientalis sp.]
MRSDDQDDGEAGAPAVAYTMDRYESMLEELRSAGRRFVGFDGFDGEDAVVLRHDVDLSLRRALAMARREADRDVSATYCVLLTTPFYDLGTPAGQRAVDELRALGHDVALHFDVHHHFDGRPARTTLVDRVTDELHALERVADAPVDVVSFHVPPDWVLNEPFDAFVNAYAPQFFGDADYVSDSSGKWRDEPPFPDGVPERFQLLVHPGLWNDGDDPPRPLEALVEEAAADARGAVDQYVGTFGI